MPLATDMSDQGKNPMDEDIIKELEQRAQPYLQMLRGPDPMRMEQRVFLSYSRKDIADVYPFHLELLKTGLRTFFDQSISMGIYITENWMDKVLQMLSTCCAMAVCWSPNLNNSAVASFEIGFFLERIKARSGVFIAVILLHKQPKMGQALNLYVPVIELYKIGAEGAADQFIKKMVEFYQKQDLEKHTSLKNKIGNWLRSALLGKKPSGILWIPQSDLPSPDIERKRKK